MLFMGRKKMILGINEIMIAKKNKVNRGVAGTHQTSKIELSGKIVNSLQAVNYFHKNSPF